MIIHFGAPHVVFQLACQNCWVFHLRQVFGEWNGYWVDY